MVTIFKEFSFDAAHSLPYLDNGHKCKNIHGHTYRLKVFIEGDINNNLGWVTDFAEVKKIIAPVIEMVDHKLLNQVHGLENPTCELLAVWFWNKIKPLLPQLQKIELNETPTSGVIYTGYTPASGDYLMQDQ